MPRKPYISKRDFDPVFKTGVRVRIRAEALARTPYLPRELGTVTPKLPQGQAIDSYVYILWDECESEAPYSKTLLELADGNKRMGND